MAQVKVAHIITDLDIGGAEYMLLKVLRNFEDSRFSHFVVSLLPNTPLREKIESEGVKVYTLGVNKISFVASLPRLISILKSERPNIVHNYLFHADILGRIAARISGVPIVISSLRNENIGGKFREMSLRLTDFCVSKVTAVSREVGRAHVKKGVTREDKIKVIYNGLELTEDDTADNLRLRKEIGLGQDTYFILTVSNLEKKKGHIYLLEALRILKQRGYDFKSVIAGSGRERRRLERQITKMDLVDRVALLGRRDDVNRLLKAADIFVLPSIWEGLPNALLEAMAAGLAVVATDVGGVTEALANNDTGLIVPPRESKTLSEAIEILFNDKSLRDRLSRNAATYTNERFNIKRTVSDTKRLYEELLDAHGKD
ncbi:MAG: glycosyltransferase [Candidatus Omnitrophica bacterium]|nr:glycosyltransferase [Candidatus Omnitrophota bacterium]